MHGARRLATGVPGDHRPTPEYLEVTGVGHYQNRSAGLQDRVLDQRLRHAAVGGLRIVLTENDHVGLARAEHDGAADLDVVGTYVRLPLDFDAGRRRMLAKGRLRLTGGALDEDISIARSEARHVGIADSVERGDARIEALGKADGDIRPNGGGIALVKVKEQVAERHNGLVPTVRFSVKP